MLPARDLAGHSGTGEGRFRLKKFAFVKIVSGENCASASEVINRNFGGADCPCISATELPAET
jgi:hypothetical protein